MGVKKFITTFISNLPATFDMMHEITAGVAIDMNQFIHQALNKLIEATTEGYEINSGVTTYFVRENIKTADDLLLMYSKSCGEIIDAVISELTLIRNLKELYITMDGTPCYGKIQNQIDRRRKPRRIARKNAPGETPTLLLSSALILPGTPVMEFFTTVLRAKLQDFLTTHPTVSLTMSLSDIPGEGEHKALDYLNASSYTSFSRRLATDSNRGMSVPHFMIWSNDSDVIISLIHRTAVNIFIMTDNVAANKVSVLKCISLANVRERLCANYREILNAPLLLAFAGNDYLPEMLDSASLGTIYARLRMLCNETEHSEAICLTKEDKPIDVVDLALNVRQNNEVVPTEDANVNDTQARGSVSLKKPMYRYSRIIDFSALRSLFRAMSDEEIVLYYTDVDNNPRAKRLLLFRDDLNTLLCDRVSFKRKYYRMVYVELMKIGVVPINDCPSDTELYMLEMSMATDYMRTYCWYYYYQSGMYIERPTSSANNCYYSYIFPPLYCSLFILLDRAEPENMIQFDLFHNQALKPHPRELDYFQRLPTFMTLHWYIVLQLEDWKILQQKVPFNEPEFEVCKTHVEKSVSVIDRYGEYLDISKRVPVEKLVETYRNLVSSTTAQPIKLGREEPGQRESRARSGPDRFRIKSMATFG